MLQVKPFNGEVIKYYDDTQQACGSTNLTFVCNSDIGAPLVERKLDDAGRVKSAVVVGILSWSPLFEGCSYSFPAVFTRFSHYYAWIHATKNNWP